MFFPAVYLRSPFQRLLMPFLDPRTTQVDASGLAFIFIICVVLPLVAIRSASRQRTEPRTASMLQRLRTVAVLVALAALSLFVAQRNGISLFPAHRHEMSHVTTGAAVLMGVLLLAEIQLRLLSTDERRKLWSRQVIPENGGSRVVWVISSALAGATEEIIFRGVLFALLAALTGSVAIGAAASAAAFALAHYRQGWKNMGFVAAIALLFQLLVILTASLVPAIVVHSIYNIARGVRASRAARA